MEQFKINNRRKPRKKDSKTIMQYIVKAINEEFHVSADFLAFQKNDT